MAAKQGAHYVIHLIWPMPPPSKARTSQPYGEYSTKYQMLTTTLWPFQGVHGRLITGPLTWQSSIQPWTTAHLHITFQFCFPYSLRLFSATWIHKTTVDAFCSSRRKGHLLNSRRFSFNVLNVGSQCVVCLWFQLQIAIYLCHILKHKVI